MTDLSESMLVAPPPSMARARPTSSSLAREPSTDRPMLALCTTTAALKPGPQGGVGSHGHRNRSRNRWTTTASAPHLDVPVIDGRSTLPAVLRLPVEVGQPARHAHRQVQPIGHAHIFTEPFTTAAANASSKPVTIPLQHGEGHRSTSGICHAPAKLLVQAAALQQLVY